MKRPIAAVLVGGLAFASGAAPGAPADLKSIHTQKTKDVVVKLSSESGQWKQGTNSFVLELASTKDNQPVDAGKVTLSTSMGMPGMAPMLAGATLTP